MRLLDIKKCINDAYERFNPKYNNSSSHYYIDNVLSLKAAIQSLYASEIITRNELAINIFTIIDSSMTDRLIVDSSQINIYKAELEKLKSTINILHNWINRYVPDTDDDTTINIKLPPLCRIKDLIVVSNIIDKALSWSVAGTGGEVKIKHLDYGSSWLIITAGTALAAKLVLLLANAAFKVAQKYYNIKMMQQQYERFSMGTEILKTIKEANEKIIASDARVLAEHIEENIYTDTDKNNERIERLRASIIEMSKLIELGGEIHPSLICASENNFSVPDYKSLLNVIKNAGELPKNEATESEGTQNIPDDNQ